MQSNCKLYYFAHPYTGNEERNFLLATSRTQELLDMGYKVLSPITYTHPLHGTRERTYGFWMDLCLSLVRHCDGIIFAPGWQKSKGCVLEFEHSEGKEIIFLEDIIT
jgi:hypothetical protein